MENHRRRSELVKERQIAEQEVVENREVLAERHQEDEHSKYREENSGSVAPMEQGNDGKEDWDD
ncbi:MAG: hypothetical protein AAB393_18105, partial [Bacteroidota bacterium]